MWHASAAAVVKMSGGGSIAAAWLEGRAREALEGVGDPERGEWIEVTPRAVHIRRRLTAEEDQKVGPVRDLRGTQEARDLWAKWYRKVPPEMWSFGKAEIA